MFTGIIEEVGKVAAIQRQGTGLRLSVDAPKSTPELAVNDSVSINGVCHTVVSKSGSMFSVDSVEETLKKTTMGSLHAGSAVNLELPMKAQSRFGGHLVLGHVDAVGRIGPIEQRDASRMYAIIIPKEYHKFIVTVGSIAIDGVSLTIAERYDDGARVSIIPHTMGNTIFSQYAQGTEVNLEFDILGKYVERLLLERTASQASKLTQEYLREQGY